MTDPRDGRLRRDPANHGDQPRALDRRTGADHRRPSYSHAGTQRLPGSIAHADLGDHVRWQRRELDRRVEAPETRRPSIRAAGSTRFRFPPRAQPSSRCSHRRHENTSRNGGGRRRLRPPFLTGPLNATPAQFAAARPHPSPKAPADPGRPARSSRRPGARAARRARACGRD